MRLFVAVGLPAVVVDVLATMERPGVAGVRWTPPAQWHVTLRFIGDVADDRVDGLVRSLGDAAAALSPVEVVLGERLAAFGPSVLYVPVEGLAAWADAVGGGSERGGFVGHVTVARGRRGRGPARGDVGPLVGSARPPGTASWVADSFTLVRSEPGAGGSVYSTVASFVVGGEHPHTNVRSQLR